MTKTGSDKFFTNLLSNSIKYTNKPGQVILTTQIEKNQLYLSIEDSAPKLSDADLVNIFKRLYRVKNIPNQAIEGSGLGLSICQNIVEAHQGNIYAEHSNSGGVKVVIMMPL